MRFSTSMMVADPFELKVTLPVIDANTDYYHIDVMDGHLVPNLALSLDFVKHLKKHASKPIHVHLMVSKPKDFLDRLIEIGVDAITVHPKTIEKEAFRMIEKIKGNGIEFGVAISPSINLNRILYYLDKIDIMTIMTVEPGFAGQSMIRNVLPKITKAVEMRAHYGVSYRIEIDGSNNKETFEEYVTRGADILVLGSSLFKYDDLNNGYKDIKRFVSQYE